MIDTDRLEHTPGPWWLSPSIGGWIDVLSNANAEGTAEVVARFDWLIPTEADARLIAAAPALKEALERVLDEQVRCDTDNPHVEVWCIAHQQKRCDMNAIIDRGRALLDSLSTPRGDEQAWRLFVKPSN